MDAVVGQQSALSQGTYYVTTFAQTTWKTYVYTTRDIEKGPWKVSSFRPMLHDHSLFFDDDGRVYMLYAAATCAWSN
jgi:beta-xylosidase